MVFAMMVLTKIVLYNLLLSQKSVVTRLEQDTGDSDSVKYFLLPFCFSILCDNLCKRMGSQGGTGHSTLLCP